MSVFDAYVVNENKKQVSLLEHIKNSSNIVIENKNIIIWEL